MAVSRTAKMALRAEIEDAVLVLRDHRAGSPGIGQLNDSDVTSIANVVLRALSEIAGAV